MCQYYGQPNISKKQQEKLESLFEIETALHILVMNVEAFSTTKGTDFASKFISSHNALMAIDESTTIKNPKAQRTKNILKLSTKTKYRRIMTGSPVTKNPLDLYSQCYFLDPFHLEHESYYSYRMRYATMKKITVRGRSIQIVDGFKHLGELSDKLKPFSYRVLKEDCLDFTREELDQKTNYFICRPKKNIYSNERNSFSTFKWQSNIYYDCFNSINEITSNYMWSFYC